MHLTRRLLYYVNRKRIPGRIDSGKEQIKKPVHSYFLYSAAFDIIREKENMDILSKPFLSEEEDKMYQHMMKQRHEDKIKEFETYERFNKMRRHYTTMDDIGHLNVTKSWL